MKTVNVLIASVASLVAAGVQADAIAKSPPAAAGAEAGQLSTKFQHALTQFIAGCSSHNSQLLNSVTTDDVRIEYSLDTPGTYLTFDAISLDIDCGINMESGGSQIRAMRIYPTNDEDVVFVEFDTTSDSTMAPSKRQLALIEMRGEKIARLLNFSPPTKALVSARGVASPSFTAHANSREAATGSE
jgi:hypothetical protein